MLYMMSSEPFKHDDHHHGSHDQQVALEQIQAGQQHHGYDNSRSQPQGGSMYFPTMHLACFLKGRRAAHCPSELCVVLFLDPRNGGPKKRTT